MAELTYANGFNAVRDLVPVNVVAPNTAPVQVVIGSNQGSVIDEITINAVTATTGGYINIYLYEPAVSAVNYYLHSQIPVTAVTPNTTTAAWSTVIRPLNLKLKHNQHLHISYNSTTPNAEQYHVTASVTDL